jgi:hypothetical protein
MVSELFNRPVVGLFGTRMSGKSTEMITINIYLELPPTTRRQWFFSDDRDLGAHAKK